MKNPKLITKPFAQNGQKNAIPENFSSSMESNQATWDQGFGQITMIPVAAGGLPPKGQDFNGIFNQLSENIVYLSKGGKFKFSADYAAAIGGYPKGAILQSDDEKKEYQSIIDNNKVNFNTATQSQINAAWKLVSTDDLLQQIAGKQPVGDYATKTELTNGLAGKQPTGDYVTKSEMSNGLNTKLDKSSVVQVTGSSTTATISQDGITKALLKKLDVGQFGFGGRGAVYNLTASELETMVKSPSTPSQIFRHDGQVSDLLYKYSATLLMGAAGIYTLISVDSKSGKVKVAAGSNNDDTVINELYGTVNTTLDRNGFLGTTNATTLITSNVTQSTGVSTANIMSQKATTDVANAITEKAFGEGQKWYDLTSQRAKMTAYTNTGKKPIFVVIGGVDSRGDPVYVTCDDVNVGLFTRTAPGTAVTVSFVVPSGSTYRLSDFDFRFWSELR